MSTAGNKHHNKSGEGVKIKEEIKKEVKEETNEERGVSGMKPVEPVVVVKREAIAGFSGSGVKAEIWNESPEVTSQPKVEIIGGTEINGETYFIVKTPDFPITRTMPYAEARSSFPQAVIRYFQKSIEWVENKDVPRLKSEGNKKSNMNGEGVKIKEEPIGESEEVKAELIEEVKEEIEEEAEEEMGDEQEIMDMELVEPVVTVKREDTSGFSVLGVTAENGDDSPAFEQIVGATKINSQMYLILKTLDSPIKRTILYEVARTSFPQAVIRYFQERIAWVENREEQEVHDS